MVGSLGTTTTVGTIDVLVPNPPNENGTTYA